MAHTPPRRPARFSRAFTSILTAGVLVAGGLTYTTIEAPAPAAAEPCIPGSSPTCGPGPGPGPTTDVPTGPATTAPQAPTTTPPGAQQPTESPSDPTPNQGGNGMNVQTPNQPTTNPNGIFGQTPTPTAPATGAQQPTTAAQPPTTGAQPTSPASSANSPDQQCQISTASEGVAPAGSPVTYTAPPEFAAAAQQAAQAWSGGGGSGSSSTPSISAAGGGGSSSSTPNLVIESINNPAAPFGGHYDAPSAGAPAKILVNLALVPAEQVASVIAHEMGHALGLPDVSTPGSIMNAGGSALPTGPQASDFAALSQLANSTGSSCSPQSASANWCPLGTNSDGGCKGAGVAKTAWKYTKCLGAVTAVFIPAAKAYKAIKALGGAKETAQLLWGASNFDDFLAIAGPVAMEIGGITGVMAFCF